MVPELRVNFLFKVYGKVYGFMMFMALKKQRSSGTGDVCTHPAATAFALTTTTKTSKKTTTG